jgi:DnaK suppressor protein
MMNQMASLQSTAGSCVATSDLDPELRAILRARLESARDAALRRVDRVEPESPALEPLGRPDAEAQQTIDLEHDVRVSLQQEQLRDAVAPILDAIERLDGGTYGLCVDCGRPIAAARLLALPYAARCLSCQNEREQDAR